VKFIASYTDGRNVKRTQFPAATKEEAEDTAKRRTPNGYRLFNLRKMKEKKAT
jgi:hypothetical protein